MCICFNLGELILYVQVCIIIFKLVYRLCHYVRFTDSFLFVIGRLIKGEKENVNRCTDCTKHKNDAD